MLSLAIVALAVVASAFLLSRSSAERVANSPTVAQTSRPTVPLPPPPPTPPESPETASDGSPPETLATTAPATAPAPPVSSGPVGTARVEDAAGDVLDDLGEPVATEAAADLAAVELRGDGDLLEIRWEPAGPPPQRHDTLLWSVDLWVDGERRYTVTVQLTDTGAVAGVLDWRSQEQVAPPRPAVLAPTMVALEVPAALISDLPATFEWSAIAQIEMAYEDLVPDAPAEGPVTRAPFPQS